MGPPNLGEIMLNNLKATYSLVNQKRMLSLRKMGGPTYAFKSKFLVSLCFKSRGNKSSKGSPGGQEDGSLNSMESSFWFS